MSALVSALLSPFTSPMQSVFVLASEDLVPGDLSAGEFSVAFSTDFDVFFDGSQTGEFSKDFSSAFNSLTIFDAGNLEFNNDFNNDFQHFSLIGMNEFSQAFSKEFARVQQVNEFSSAFSSAYTIEP